MRYWNKIVRYVNTPKGISDPFLFFILANIFRRPIVAYGHRNVYYGMGREEAKSRPDRDRG